MFDPCSTYAPDTYVRPAVNVTPWGLVLTPTQVAPR